MKIRHGHVSNSSSSSFILGVDKPLDTLEAIKEQIFSGLGDNTEGWISHEYNDDPIHIQALCISFKRESDKSTITDYDSLYTRKSDDEYQEEYDDSLLSEIGFQIMYETGDGRDWYNKVRGLVYHSDEYTKLREERNAHVLQVGRKYLDSRREEFEGKYLYLVTFADEDGSIGCHLEHGNHWYKILHIRISNH